MNRLPSHLPDAEIWLLGGGLGPHILMPGSLLPIIFMPGSLLPIIFMPGSLLPIASCQDGNGFGAGFGDSFEGDVVGAGDRCFHDLAATGVHFQR
jgi:hypothetical protein